MERVRLRELGIKIGSFSTGKWNAITDVPGVQVGHVTLSYQDAEGNAVRTGVTAVLPHPGNLFQEKVIGSCYVINGFGKTVGTIQLTELGVIESPILLTNTLSVSAALAGGIEYSLEQNPEIGETTGTVNVVVGECNDGYLNHIRGRHVTPQHALEAIRQARSGSVEEGCVGAGTGMSCLGYKGGIGTSSRQAEFGDQCYTVGALVVSNFGERGEMLLPGKNQPVPVRQESVVQNQKPDGSIMIVVATDAPLSDRQLHRVAKRAAFGLARTGSYAAHGSGDIVISFSTSQRVLHKPNRDQIPFHFIREDGEWISRLFAMAAEAVEEAIWNSLCMAVTTVGYKGNKSEAIPYSLFQ